MKDKMVVIMFKFESKYTNKTISDLGKIEKYN